MVCCGSEQCLSLSSRILKLLDPDVVQVMLSGRNWDSMDHSNPTASNCR